MQLQPQPSATIRLNVFPWRIPQNPGDHEFAHRKSPCPPTQKTLVNNAVVKKALDEAFQLSLDTRLERGGWIFWNSKTGKISYAIKDPPTRGDDPRRPQGDTYWQVYLDNPPPPPRGYVIAGVFHTHPENFGADDWDIALENRQKVPGIVRTPDGKARPYGPNRGIWETDLPSYCR